MLNLLLLPLASPVLLAQEPVEALSPIPAAYRDLGDEVRKLDEHIVFLANPFLKGRLPGTPGMVITEDYVERHFIDAGLEPAFGDSYRQSVPLGDARLTQEGDLSIGDWEYVRGEDFDVSLSGGSGAAEAELVFVGYAANSEDQGYSAFSGAQDLAGKIAVVYRFEPMDENGRSLWGENGRWSRAGGFSAKFGAIAEQGAEAIILVNPPGSSDPRAAQIPIGRSNAMQVNLPILGLTTASFAELLERSGSQETPDTLRAKADKAGIVMPLGVKAKVHASIDNQTTTADNIVGLLPGRGELAKEVVLIGGHIDHLGMGVYGSRGARGQLHPGADDNASGTAATIMLAERLKPWMDSLPEGTQARSILFVGFNAEEAGLDGARHYVRNPAMPIEAHSLMINFDMIGRISNRKLQVLGTQTGEGLRDWFNAIADQSPLQVRAHNSLNLGSDHLPFISADVPAIFAIIDPLHGDYHTPADTSDKINRVDSVHTVDLFEAILQSAALLTERHIFVSPRR